MDAASLSPWSLFLQADIVVKAVMLGLLAASVWSWAIIVDRARTLELFGLTTAWRCTSRLRSGVGAAAPCPSSAPSAWWETSHLPCCWQTI